jgi:hypothetical protein
MKLQLKHLAPYLPYGLKNKRAFHKPRVIDGIVGNKIYFGDTVLFINQIKPILRPLSDLTKQDNLVFNVEIYSGLINNIQNQETTQWGVWEYELLLKNHFDVFGLIEKGLAIDINTL